MRGDDQRQGAVFSYVSLEDRVPSDHPLRPLRTMVNEALAGLSDRFEAIYADEGRPSIPPERLLRALLLQMLFSVRSERQLMEQIDYNLLFRWFVGLGIDDPVWNPTTFTKNRDRLLGGDVAGAFFQEVLDQARGRGLLSSDHFTVDGTLIDAWASLKSFRRKDDDGKGAPPPDDQGNPTVNFHGEKRSNATHESKTDPEAKLAKKGPGKEAKLSYMGHVLTENRNGLVTATRLTDANGHAERDAAREMLQDVPGNHRITVGADKGYDTRDFVAAVRDLRGVPHVAQNTTNRRSAINGRTTRHPGYGISQRRRKRVEEVFGWMKTVALFRKVRHRGKRVLGWLFTLAAATYNLVRMRNLELQPV